MEERKRKILSEGDTPDDVIYETTFYYDSEDGVQLYEESTLIG